jgi:hypothetical protein
MIAFDLSLGLGMVGLAPYMVYGLILQELLQISGHITGSII